MNIYQVVALVLVVGPVLIGVIGFFSRWSQLGPYPVESHAKVWGRRCPKCQSEEFVTLGDGRHQCSQCGHEFI